MFNNFTKGEMDSGSYIKLITQYVVRHKREPSLIKLSLLYTSKVY